MAYLAWAFIVLGCVAAAVYLVVNGHVCFASVLLLMAAGCSVGAGEEAR